MHDLTDQRKQAFVCVAWSIVVAAGRTSAQEEQLGTLPFSRAAACFAEFEEACARDGGRLWGMEVCGPVLLVDPATRKVLGNCPDEEGRLEERSGVFAGMLPPDKPMANAPLEWAGVRWAMVMLPYLGETKEERVVVMAHESFHRVQPQLGLFPLNEECEHLDAPEGRLWMRLEWNALEIALSSSDEARLLAVQDALDFRAARRARFPEAGARENPLEIREGLANYTGLRIAGRTSGEVVAYVANRRGTEDGFVRSFAYNSGPLYGYLLDASIQTWQSVEKGPCCGFARFAWASSRSSSRAQRP